MTKHVIDAYAWIEYLDGTDAGRKVTAILENNDDTYTCAVTLAEVVSKVARKGKDPKIAYGVLMSNSQVVSVDDELSLQAGILHCEMRKTAKDFGLADAFVLATARRLKSKILTGDAHFKPLKEAIMI
jgi:PIN domain nuclease of toxin-antitoxin system